MPNRNAAPVFGLLAAVAIAAPRRCRLRPSRRG